MTGQDHVFTLLQSRGACSTANVRNTIEGNGFGLSVAKGAVEAQGGQIWFESTEGKGSTFFVELPLGTA